jgi:hypothetical protein
MIGTLLATACFVSAPAASAKDPSQSGECRPEVIRPDAGPRSAAFLTWLQAHARQALGDAAYVADGSSVAETRVLIADIDNDGRDEYVLADWEGSGHYLSLWVFDRSGDSWTLRHGPLGEIKMAHDYRGPQMDESQLLVRFCGRVYVSFMGGEAPHYSPATFVWQGGKALPACDTPWLRYQRRTFQGLFDAGRYDDAHGLLDGVQSSCASAADPETWLWMQSDLALTAHRMKAYGDCLDHVTAARKSAAFAKAGPALRKALSANAALCAGAKTKTARSSRPSYDFTWLMAEVERRPDQQLVLDPRFDGLLSAIVPEWKLEDGKTLRDALKLAVWLPDPAEVVADRYLVITGCEPHNCGNRGLIWIDAVARRSIVSIGELLASTTIDAADVPQEFWDKARVDDGDLDYVGPSGSRTRIRRPDAPASRR